MKLRVNTGLLDATRVKAETLAQYDEIKINTGMVLVSEDTKDILFGSTKIKINMGSMLEGDPEKFQMYNGTLEIAPTSQSVPEGAILIINGSLLVHPGGEGVLGRAKSVMINGNLECADNCPTPATIKINGHTHHYPSDAVIISEPLTAARLAEFEEGKLYYLYNQRLDLLDEQLAEAMQKTQARIMAKSAVVNEGLWARISARVTLRNKPTLVPDGFAFVDEPVFYPDDLSVLQYGGKLYANGDVILTAQTTPTLGELEALYARKKVYIPAADVPALKAKLGKSDIFPYRGQLSLIRDQNLTFTATELAGADAWTIVAADSNVTFAEDITAEQIEQRLAAAYIRDSNVTFANDGQAAAFRQKLREQNDSNINVCRELDDEPEETDVVRVNTGAYVL